MKILIAKYNKLLMIELTNKVWSLDSGFTKSFQNVSNWKVDH